MVKNNFHQDKKDLPFIFGTFSYSGVEESEDMKRNFYSAFWNYSAEENRFHTIKFSMTNLGVGKYPNKINHNTNRSLYNLVNIESFEKQVDCLVSIIKGESSEIGDTSTIDSIKEIKSDINTEIKEFINILNMMKIYNNKA